jgi:hypothetical protein
LDETVVRVARRYHGAPRISNDVAAYEFGSEHISGHCAVRILGENRVNRVNGAAGDIDALGSGFVAPLISDVRFESKKAGMMMPAFSYFETVKV